MDFRRDTINEFVDKLASSSPVPGGGGAAALSAALSSALSSMVFNLTVGKKSYEALDGDKQLIIKKALEDCIIKTEEFLQYINKDAEAFSSLMDAYKFPKESEEEKQLREQKIQQGLYNSMMIPFHLAEETVKFMETISIAAEYGNVNVITDAGVSVIMAYATIESCILNVMVNVKFIKTDSSDVVENCKELQNKAEIIKDQVLSKVYGKI